MGTGSGDELTGGCCKAAWEPSGDAEQSRVVSAVHDELTSSLIPCSQYVKACHGVNTLRRHISLNLNTNPLRYLKRFRICLPVSVPNMMLASTLGDENTSGFIFLSM